MIVGNSSQHLTYCLNIHPGESWVEQEQAVFTHAAAVRDRLGEENPFGLGLRISAQAARELNEPGVRDRFRDRLEAHRMYAFTVNAFPYGTFHQARVKASVYEPDWRTPERVDYTLDVARHLAALLPDAVDGSVSTVPGSFKTWIRTEADIEMMTRNLAEVIHELAVLENTTGRFIHLGLEPEPACFLETTPETIRFFKEHLLRGGVSHLATSAGWTRERAESVMRRHAGVNFDACHLAIQYENLADSLRALRAEGIRLSKVHISAALEAANTPEARQALDAFHEPVYLHQVVARYADGSTEAWTDLPEALPALVDRPADSQVRVHFHVPLFWEGDERLASTSIALDEAVWREIQVNEPPHLEIETYTFDVLPEKLKSGDVVDSIVREYQWVQPRLSAATAGKAP